MIMQTASLKLKLGIALPSAVLLCLASSCARDGESETNRRQASVSIVIALGFGSLDGEPFQLHPRHEDETAAALPGKYLKPRARTPQHSVYSQLARN